MFELKWQNTFTNFSSAVELTATRFQGRPTSGEIECCRLLSEGDPETTESEGIHPRKNCAQRTRDFC